MFRPGKHSTRQSTPVRGRRGAILIVVLGLLTLFAILGISFVYTADAEANASRNFKDSQNQTALTPPDATAAVNQFLGSLIYPVSDNDTTNSLRGHELLRAMYGGRPGSNVPYNGVGTFHEDVRNYGHPGIPVTYPVHIDRAHCINHTAMMMNVSRFLLDPEWTGVRGLDAANNFMGPPAAGGSTQAYVAKNAPYTYPDLKDLYLGSVSPTTGEVLVKSFHRDWSFNADNPNAAYRLAPWNPNDNAPATQTALNTDWVTREGRLKILRPRPIDQLDVSDPIPPGFNPLPTKQMLQAMPLAQQQAMYDLLRNKIAAGEILGYPQQNADTTFSGDQVNLPGGVGTKNADSILIDAGMPVIQLSNGKFVKPMVSALIQDLNGRLDLSSHGNVQNSGAHNSYHGLGKWEVSLVPVLQASGASSIVTDRQGNTATYGTRAGVAARAFDGSGTRLPAYAAVNWQVNANGTSPTLPTAPGSTFQTVPTYVSPFEDNTTTPNHPSLFNPAEWGGNTAANARKTYPLTNLRRMGTQYAPTALDYLNMTFPAAAGLIPSTSGNGYRLNASHAKVGLLTTRSTSLDRPGLMPNYINLNTGQALQLRLGQQFPDYPAGYLGTFPDAKTATPAPDTDYGTQNWQNTRAALGPVDLNRQLSDYRDPTLAANNPPAGPLGPLGPTTVSQLSFNKASLDRQNLARDIFARLIVATGAFARVDPVNGNVTITITEATNFDEFSALRYLAQVAVNMVDYIDPDDVSTPFIWNPTGGVLSPLTNPSTDPSDATGYSAILAAHLTPSVASPPTVPSLQGSVVFGVEKPRLVINEALGEVTNNPTDSMPPANVAVTGASHVKFWVELINPTNTPYAAPPFGPMNTGAATLYYGPGHNPYQLVVTRPNKGPGANAASYLLAPAFLGNSWNVGGDLPPGHVPDIVFNFDSTDIATTPAKQTVGPNNGTYSGLPAGTPGVVVVGPPAPAVTNPIQFNPDLNTAPWNGMLKSNPIAPAAVSNAMGYELPLQTAAQYEAPGSDLPNHLVLLRRLANPYLPASATNPYVTVDVVNHVPAHDAVHRASTMTMNRMQKPTPYAGAGYEGIGDRFAVGKIQPYASQSARAAGAGTLYVPTLAQFNAGTFSTILQQSPAPANAAEPKHTMFRQNGMNAAAPGATYATPPTLTDTVMAPFDWFVHFDRPLINQLELLHMQAVKPHLVTEYAMQTPTAAANPPQKTLGLVPWQTAGNGLYRALDTLRVQDRTYGVPLGGKVHGRVNINAIMHPDVFRGLLDPQSGNAFATADVVFNGSGTDLWGRLIGAVPASQIANRPYRTASMQTRTLADGATTVQVPVPGPSVHDINPINPPPNVSITNLDRPYLSFGAPQFLAPTMEPVFAAPAGMGLQDTLLRADPSDPTRRPLIYTPVPTSPTPDLHPYFQAEAARKVLNNLTTTSDTFAVSFTISFHEVRVQPLNGSLIVDPNFPARNLLGKEYYNEQPGDLRQQFFALIDRANAGTDLNTLSTSYQPFFTTLESSFVPPPPPAMPPPPPVTLVVAAVDNGSGQPVVFSDGQAVPLVVGTSVMIGVGANADGPVTISAATPTAVPGLWNITVPGGILTKPQAVGSCVSNFNARLPLLATTFQYSTPSNPSIYQGVLPYFIRVR